MYSVHYIQLYSVYIVYTVQCTVYTVQCTLYKYSTIVIINAMLFLV